MSGAGLPGEVVAAGRVLGDELLQRPVVSETVLHHGYIFDLVGRRVDLGAAGVVDRDLLRHPGAVAVVALDEQERVLLIRQYRVPVAAFLWELPAGLVDPAADGGPGESLLAAARRELAEETDVAAESWQVLIDYATTPGASDEALRVFLARNLHPAGEQSFVREGEESEIEVVWVPLDDAVEAVLAGRIHNPSAVAGLLAADRARRDGFTSLRDVSAPHLLRPGWLPA